MNQLKSYIKPYLHISNRDILIGVLAFAIGFSSIFLSRTIRLNQSDAVYAEEQQVLYLDERITIDALPRNLDVLDIDYDAESLKWASSITRFQTFQPGRYELEGGMSYEGFLRKLAHGLQDPGRVMIAPGITKESFAMRVAAQMNFESEDLLEAMQDSTVLAELDIEEHLLLGRMLPDTYEMFWTSTPQQFLRRMLREFDNRVAQRYEDRMQELGKTPDEIATLASIIEWEARVEDEKPVIGGLYWNRLDNNWRLQADPTVSYAVGERRRLIYEDYRVDHPYNTYRFTGLPPGPITNPSYTSIRAALFPEEHDYYYMVATPEGDHAFSETYAEHQRRSREWTQWLREQRMERQRREAEAAREAEASGSN